MRIQLSDHFTYGKLIRFSLPSIVMMIFTSIYGVVDGLFISNFAGDVEFTAVNLIMPIFMIIGAFGFMMGAGGTAIVAKTLGQKEPVLANRYFSLFIYVTAIAGAVMALLGIILLRPISFALGADGALLEACVRYGRIVILAMPFFMLQNLFQSFFIVAEKPQLGLAVTIGAGVTNMMLDALLVTLLPQEIKLEGAAIATSVSQMVGGTVPIIYFVSRNKSLLRLGKTRFYFKALIKAMTNGSSELMSNISFSVVTMLYNMQLMKHAPEYGVAAYGVIMYVGFIFVAVSIGYSVGVAPIIGYHYGAGNTVELKNLLKKSTIFCGVSGVVMSLIAFFFARPLALIFVSYNEELLNLTVHGFKIYAFSFLMTGFCIFGSSFFTALNNGIVSAAISFMRTMLFQIALILILPILFELEGVWYSMVAAEAFAILTTFIFLLANRKKYKYM